MGDSKYLKNRILFNSGPCVNWFGYDFHDIDRDMDVC